MSLGVYPETSLKDARGKLRVTRKLLEQGIDPAIDRKIQHAAKHELVANSFERMAREWFAKFSPGWQGRYNYENYFVNLQNMTLKTLIKFLSGLLAVLLSSDAQSAALYDCLIEPTQTVDISSPVAGLLEKVSVRRGDKVHKGQVIANLESSAEAASVALAFYKSEMSAPIITAENKIKFAKLKYERRRDMQAQNFMSGQERDEAEAEMKLDEDELKLAQENKAVARLEWRQQSSLLNLRTIRSPFDGVVVDQLLYPGEVVEPGGQKKTILKLAQLNPLRIYVILPMSAFGKVTRGMKVDVYPELPVGGHFIGNVIIIDRVVNAASGTFSVFLEVANPSLDVPAGIECKAEFPTTFDALNGIRSKKISLSQPPPLLDKNKAKNLLQP